MEQSIELYHDLYITCGSMGLVFIVIAVILYYVFDIQKIIKDMLGITKKTAIKEMEEHDERILKYQEKIREMQQKFAGTAERAAARVKAQFIEQEASEHDKKRNQLSMEKLIKSRQDTNVKMEALDESKSPSKAPSEEKEPQKISPDGPTEVLQEEVYIPRGNTMVLNPMMMPENSMAEKEVKQRQIRFILERQILMTHTDEVIDF